MRVVFLITVTALEGSTYSLFQLIRGLKHEGVECKVIATRKGYYCDVMDKEGIPYEIIRYRNSNYPSFRTCRDMLYYVPLLALLAENYINYSKVKRAIKEFRPDIIHTNVSPITIGYRVAKELNIPHVWHVREYVDKDFKIKPFPSFSSLRKKLQDSYTITITKDVKKHFNLGNKCRAIYDGVYYENEYRFVASKKPYFLFVGFLMECKGVFDLLASYVEYCKLVDAPFELYLVGGYTSETYDRMISILLGSKAQSFVKIIGKQDIETVKNYMQEATCMFVPSHFEGFGRITAEAMFNGCLVAGRDTGGTKEQFDNGLNETGKEIALRFTDNEQMTRIMYNLTLQKIEQYYPMIERAQNVVRKLYSIESNVHSVLRFYSEINENYK